MNIFNYLGIDDTPRVYHIDHKFFPRTEKCPVCNVLLCESYKTKTDVPTNSMLVRIGKKYNSWPVSDKIFCPKCKMVFNHEPTDIKTLSKFIFLFADGDGFISMRLTEDFDISQFETSLKSNLKKGTMVYCPVTKKSSKQRKQSLRFLSLKIKPPIKKEDGYMKGRFQFRINQNWDFFKGVYCVTDPNEMFEVNIEGKILDPFRSWNSIPIELLELPDDDISLSSVELLAIESNQFIS